MRGTVKEAATAAEKTAQHETWSITIQALSTRKTLRRGCKPKECTGLKRGMAI